MSLLKPIEGGRMYPGWWRWNVIAGCKHGCSYCAIKRIEKRSRLDMTTPVFRNGENGTKNYMNDNLGSGRKIFVCSSGDMWGEWVKSEDIQRVLEHCKKYPDNEYMVLSKNLRRYSQFQRAGKFPDSTILGATIETDLERLVRPLKSQATPTVENRLNWMEKIRAEFWSDVKTMISVEPVVKFSGDFSARIYDAGPDIVYIGADSGNNGLPEPSADELRGLVADLEAFTVVKLKKGLDRLLKARV